MTNECSNTAAKSLKLESDNAALAARCSDIASMNEDLERTCKKQRVELEAARAQLSATRNSTCRCVPKTRLG